MHVNTLKTLTGSLTTLAASASLIDAVWNAMRAALLVPIGGASRASPRRAHAWPGFRRRIGGAALRAALTAEAAGTSAPAAMASRAGSAAAGQGGPSRSFPSTCP